ncbi:MAG: hypothetical protein DMG48_06570 [Acidobacteria bacterium]|nr:MAG: hypothetical protein DMG48_06570 [Acidobacteriota bacterium]
MRKLNAVLLLCLALLFCSNVQAQTNSGVNNAELNGNYAFTFSGFTGNNGGSSVFATVGRFTADGSGNIASGELDANGVAPGAVLTAQAFTGTYSIGADNRGVMTLNIPGGAKFAFAMTANGNAEFIEFDASGGAGTIGSGKIEKSDTSGYSAAAISGDYAFGADGFDDSNNRAAIAGRFTSNGAGALTNEAADINAYGTTSSMTFSSANYTVSDTATGRGTINFAFSLGGSPFSLNYAFYVVNAGKLFAMGSDPVSASTPLLNGVVLRQQSPAGGFSNASLNGGMVIYMTGFTFCGNGSGRSSDALAGLLTADGNGALNATFDENCGGVSNSISGLTGTYSVASNGRASIAVANGAVAYLVSPNQAFLFATDSSIVSGFGEPQASASFTNSTLNGNYAGVAATPASFGVQVFSGEFTADGASPTGNMTGTEDIGASAGPVSGAAFQAAYSVASSPTNGRGTMTVSSGTGGNAVIYMISASTFVAVSLNDPNPAVLLFELSPTSSPSVTLSTLSLNPTTVTGGDSSTGTVTLSGPAPSGGAQVALSSNDTSVATVPSSVTVAAGATSATFTVSTSAVSASTTVTISASYAGVTKTASLTVNPTAPPTPTLTSLTLSPTSVTGGNSSTGTVTLSGPAPSGGAQVALSSSDTSVATVPSSVTVADGATSATFTVRTSAVSASTTVTISATFAGVTKTASLTVNPAPPPPPTLSSLTLNPSTVIGGVQSSTGRVTLSEPVPAGGVTVILSSNSGTASVPSSVFIPAGATSATFTVNTSIVLISTSANISATYNGTTRTATLTVLL